LLEGGPSKLCLGGDFETTYDQRQSPNDYRPLTKNGLLSRSSPIVVNSP